METRPSVAASTAWAQGTCPREPTLQPQCPHSQRPQACVRGAGGAGGREGHLVPLTLLLAAPTGVPARRPGGKAGVGFPKPRGPMLGNATTRCARGGQRQQRVVQPRHARAPKVPSDSPLWRGPAAPKPQSRRNWGREGSGEEKPGKSRGGEDGGGAASAGPPEWTEAPEPLSPSQRPLTRESGSDE